MKLSFLEYYLMNEREISQTFKAGNRHFNENTKRIMISEDDYIAEMIAYYNSVTNYYEIEMQIYRKGHRKEATNTLIKGGKMSKEAQATSLDLLAKLFKKMTSEWKNMTCFTEPSDNRRMRVYTKALKKYGIDFKVDGTILWIYL